MSEELAPLQRVQAALGKLLDFHDVPPDRAALVALRTLQAVSTLSALHIAFKVAGKEHVPLPWLLAPLANAGMALFTGFVFLLAELCSLYSISAQRRRWQQGAGLATYLLMMVSNYIIHESYYARADLPWLNQGLAALVAMVGIGTGLQYAAALHYDRLAAQVLEAEAERQRRLVEAKADEERRRQEAMERQREETERQAAAARLAAEAAAAERREAAERQERDAARRAAAEKAAREDAAAERREAAEREMRLQLARIEADAKAAEVRALADAEAARAVAEAEAAKVQGQVELAKVRTEASSTAAAAQAQAEAARAQAELERARVQAEASRAASAAQAGAEAARVQAELELARLQLAQAAPARAASSSQLARAAELDEEPIACEFGCGWRSDVDSPGKTPSRAYGGHKRGCTHNPESPYYNPQLAAPAAD